jgi:predicted nucleic acid-binding protein
MRGEAVKRANPKGGPAKGTNPKGGPVAGADLSANSFVDTNVLAYLYDGDADSKKKLAAFELVDGLAANKTLFISTQVLGELYSVLTKKFGSEKPATAQIVSGYSNAEIVSIEPEHVFRAMEISAAYQLSYYDSLIISAAERAACRTVYSEDLSHNQLIGRTRVVNPFKAARY